MAIPPLSLDQSVPLIDLESFTSLPQPLDRNVSEKKRPKQSRESLERNKESMKAAKKSMRVLKHTFVKRSYTETAQRQSTELIRSCIQEMRKKVDAMQSRALPVNTVAANQLAPKGPCDALQSKEITFVPSSILSPEDERDLYQFLNYDLNLDSAVRNE
jgi:hypothetical protein